MNCLKLAKTDDGVYTTLAILSKDEWVDVLTASDDDKHRRQLDTLLMFYRHPDHKATCSDIAKEYSMTASAIDALITHYCQFVKNYFGDKFQIIASDSEKECFWPIAMIGKSLSKSRFEWSVRPELVDAIREFLIMRLLNAYSKRITNEGLDNSVSDELYKWKLISKTLGKGVREVLYAISDSGSEMNLLPWRSKSSLRKMLQTDEQATIDCFSLLLNPDNTFEENFAAYKERTDTLVTGDIINHINSERVAAVFLAFMDPVNNVIFQNTLYDTYRQYLGIPKLTSGSKYVHYLDLLNELVKYEQQDSKLLAKLHSETDQFFWSDLLNAQDVLWQMQDFMNESKPKNWLQKMYDDAISSDNWVYRDWFPEYQKSVNSFITMFDDGKTASDVPDDVKEYFIRTPENYISSNGQGCYTYDEYAEILKIWPEIYDVLRRNYIRGAVDQTDYDNLEKRLRSLTSKNRPAAYHRLWAGLFPVSLSTVITDNRFYRTYNIVREQDSALPASTGDWLKDNLTIQSYINSKVTFKDSWHSSLFVWYLHDYLTINDNNTPMDKYIKLLEKNYNLVLTGAPGTGKTYLAEQIAMRICGGNKDHIKMVQFHPSYDYTDFVEGLRPTEDASGFRRTDGVFKKFCSDAISTVHSANFDEAYGKLIEDLSERTTPLELMTATGSKYGISVNSSHSLNLHTGDELKINGSLTKANLESQLGDGNYFKWWKTYFKGVEKLLVDKYGLSVDTKKANEKYVFIIDEINRGELSKIFGELFFSIDPGYRGEKGLVCTQYQNMVEEGDPFYKGFYVPENVYIIGTMNDIDRSVESMDFAIRRRFAWVEVSADERSVMLEEKIPDWADDAKKSMKALNDAIKDKRIGLTSAYDIGPAYYAKLEKYDGNFEELWECHIKGLLYEYLRGSRDIDEKLEKILKPAFDSYKK